MSKKKAWVGGWVGGGLVSKMEKGQK